MVDARRHSAHGHWLGELPPAEAMPPLQGIERADVVVIGGGYTGMWAAWTITELGPDARVALLEARRAGEGPSGRNGGFVNGLWFSLPQLRRSFGDTDAIEIARAAQDAVDRIGTWCEEEDVDAHYLRGGYLQASASPAQDGAWEAALLACAELGAPERCVPLEEAEIRARCDSPLFRGGVFYPSAATVHPARLAAGLRARLIERGVGLYEGSPVTRLSVGADVVAGTRHGEVRAGAAVLALGSRSGIVPSLARRLTVTSSHMVVTEPVPDVLEEIGWTGGESITDSRAMVHYFRTTHDDRIAFGWGGGHVAPGARVDGRSEIDPEITDAVAARLREFFPQLEGRGIDHAWGGPIDVSPTHLPVVGSVEPRVHYAFGYTGNGVGPSALTGRILGMLALERTDPETRLGIVDPPSVKVPPEPLRYAGGTIIRRALLRKERLEDAGEAVDAITREVARIPERMGIHIGR